MTGIRLEHLEKQYPQGPLAVADLNLDIAGGELLVLVGPSGCGKSTTLRLIAGLETPTRGRIVINEKDVTKWPPHLRNVAMVFQNHALYPHLTVRGNLEFGLRLRRTPRLEIAKRVHETARFLQLESILNRKPQQLSGGQRQRAALGRALVQRPDVYLLDEPLSQLDAQLREQTRVELARVHQELGATMLHVTHDQEEALTLGRRVAVLREGRLQQVSSPAEVYQRPANLFVASFIGSPLMNLFNGQCRRESDHVCIETPSFLIDLKNVDLLPRSKIIIGIRPHDVHPCVESEADAIAHVEMVQLTGAQANVHLQLAAPNELQTITMVTAAENVPPRGSRMPIWFRRERLHFFDPDNHSRIGLA